MAKFITHRIASNEYSLLTGEQNMKTNRTSVFAAIYFFVSVLCINPNTVLAMGGPDTITSKGSAECPAWTKYRKAGGARYIELITVGILTGMQWRPYGQDYVNFLSLIHI